MAVFEECGEDGEADGQKSSRQQGSFSSHQSVEKLKLKLVPGTPSESRERMLDFTSTLNIADCTTCSNPCFCIMVFIPSPPLSCRVAAIRHVIRHALLDLGLLLNVLNFHCFNPFLLRSKVIYSAAHTLGEFLAFPTN